MNSYQSKRNMKLIKQKGLIGIPNKWTKFSSKFLEVPQNFKKLTITACVVISLAGINVDTLSMIDNKKTFEDVERKGLACGFQCCPHFAKKKTWIWDCPHQPALYYSKINIKSTLK